MGDFYLTGNAGNQSTNFNCKQAGSLRKVASVLLTLLFVFCINTIYAQGPGQAWEYSRSVTLSGATPLANFQVKVTLSAGQYTNMKTDGSDLRFYDNSNATCNYWIESWNNTGASVIWVNAATSGTNTLKMYYGNPAATAVSNGNTTFDFFDDFLGTSLNANWLSNSLGGTLVVSGGQVTLNNTVGNMVSMYSAFIPPSPSFIIEAKHNEGSYYRNRFYATTAALINNSANDNNPIGGDYGYFSNGSASNAVGTLYWKAFQPAAMNAGTDYLTRWDVTTGANYSWSTYNYNSGSLINTNSQTVTDSIRYLTFKVTENRASTIVDWARVRKAGATEIISTVGAETSNLPIPTVTSLGSSSGCQGSNITINGTGFTTAFTLSVKIGGTPVTSIVSRNGTTIVAVIGAGTTGTVTVTTSGGTGTSTGTFIVNSLSTANAGSAMSAICQNGTSSALGGTTAGGATGGMWSVNVAGGIFTPDANTLNATWAPPAGYSGTATLTLTAVGGGSCGNTSDSKTLLVNAAPAGTLAASATSICAGSPVTFTAPAGYSSYNFQVNSNSVVSGTANTFSPANLVTGDVVSVIITSSAGCIATFTAAPVTINAYASGSFGASENSGIATGDNIICQGDMVNFDFDNSAGNTNYKFILNGTTTLYSGPNPFLSTTLLNDGASVTLEVTGAGGCVKTFGPQVITVTALPSGSLIAEENSGTANDSAICAGANVKFTAPAGYTNYDFQVNGTSIVSGSSNVFNTSALNNNDAVSVIVTNSNNCTVTFGPVTITVNALPAKPVIAAGGATTFCAGGSVTLTASSATTYQWNLNGLPVSGASSQTYMANAGGNYTVSVTNNNSCAATSDSTIITVNPLPASPVITAGGPVSFCIGGSVTLTSSIATSYKWYLNGSPVSGANLQSFVANVSGDYTVAITNSNGCGATSAATTIIVNPLPAVPTISADGPLTFCTGSSVTLTSSSSTGNQWNLNGTSISGATSASYIANAAGNYTVSVTNGNGCSATSIPTSITTNPLPDPSLNGPNPICPGSTGTYTTESGSGIHNYIWTLTGGTKISGGGTSDNSITVKWDQPGTKTIYVNYQNSYGCSAAESKTVTTSSNPLPSITGSNTVCVNYPGSVYASEPGNTNYIWTVNGGIITSGGSLTDNTVTVTWTTPGAKSISVNYSNASGCTAVGATVYHVTVNPLPVATFSYAASAYCANGANALPTLGSGAQAGTFTSTTGIVINTTTGSVNVSASTPGTYTVTNTIAAAGGCNVVAATSGITITAVPTAAIVYLAASYCVADASSEPVALSGTGAYAGGAFSAASGLSINAGTGTVIPASSTPGTYVVTYSIPAAGGCSSIPVTTSVTITALPTAAISYTGSPFCISLTSGQPVTLTGTGAYTGGTYSAPPGLNINAATGVITPNASSAGSYIVTYTTPSTGGCGAVTTTASVTITAVPAASISYTGTPFCATLTAAPVSLSGTGAYSGGTYSSATTLSIDPVSGKINPSLSTAGTYTVTYTIPVSGGCTAAPVTTSVTITKSAVVNAGNPVSTCASAGAVNVTAGSVATNYSTVTWMSNGTGTWTNANSLSNATYTPGTSDKTAGSVTLSLTATGTGNCGSVTSTKTLTINPNPSNFFIKSAGTTFCQGTIQPLTAVQSLSGDASLTFSSGNISQAIPDNNFAGTYNTVAVSGIPAGAVVTSMSVTYNITHTYDGDLFINLKAPNNNVLNVANSLNGTNFTNTVISSAATQPIQTFGVTPYSGTYLPQAQNGIPGAGSVPGGSTQTNTTSFSDLYSVLNGNWYFSVRDGGAGDTGTINSWSLTINYSVPVISVPVTWSPFTDLYTDAAATVLYTGQTTATVYAKSSTSGTKVYTATSANAAGCTNAQSVSLSVKPTPVVSVITDYCATPGNITLTANAPGATSYNWSTGETSQSVLVDIAHSYYVSVSNSDGCVGTGIASVAQELVVNGDFTAGNTGFTSDYAYKDDIPNVNTELVNDNANNGYAVGTNGQNYHPSFWGVDHTNNQNGDRNFMLINGHGSTLTIWQQTVNVLPNTDYYFSAWAMSLNAVAPYGKLQFEVNGVKVGTIASLVAGPSTAAQAAANNYWTRFYSNPKWSSGSISGPITISIVNNETALSGNDFALDDISFGTLSPFIEGPEVDGTDYQVVCAQTAIQPITYKVGSGASGPQITGLPPGVSFTYDGLTAQIIGTPTAAGTFNYTISTAGTCPNPKAATGTIKVNPTATITLTSTGKNVQTLCLNSNVNPITYTIGGGGTGAAFIGLPAGISSSYVNGVATLTGSVSASGTFTYLVKTTGTCNQDSSGGVITIRPATVGGAVSSPVICMGSGGTLTLSGNVGNVDHWEVSNDGTIYTTIANTTNTQSFSNITQSTFYRVQVKNDVCAANYSTGGKIKISNLWEGKFSSDWSVPQNWSAGTMPDNSCSGTVTIPKVTGSNYNPVVTTTATVTNLSIMANGSLAINGGNLQVSGSIINMGVLDAGNGGIEFNGVAAQTIAANTFLNNKIKDLKISNSNATGVIMNGPVDVYRSLTYGTNGKNLNTNGFLTLKSTAIETAWLGNMTGHNITGDVTVERYIGTGAVSAGNHGKSWQLLATPTTGQTIKNAWQEGATTANGNPNPGFGTQVTGAGGTGAGFDVATSTPSVKTYNYLTNGYDGVANTQLPVYNKKGYFVFVRGDRSVITANGNAIPTVLRTKGTLFTPANLPPVTTVAADKFESVGNPYASALDLRNISKSAKVNDFFQVWDPRLGGALNYGAFQTFFRDPSTGNYEVIPGYGSYGAPGTVNNFIQSGQAFIVQTTGGSGTVSFTENSKASGSALVARPASAPQTQQMLRTDLNIINADGSTTLADAVLNNFDDSYSNSIDGLDARKSVNTGENLSIRTGGVLLVVERKHTITQKDTIFLNLTTVRVQQYQFHFTAENITTGVLAFLEDSYLNTRTPLSLNGSTIVNFNIVNIPGAYVANRFRIVFAPAAVLPVTFTSIKAYAQGKNINVEWAVENEMNIKQYEVEKSINGIKFTTLAVKAATANGGHSATYITADANPLEGYNYYRVKSVDIDGKTAYTNIVKVLTGSIKQDIVIYPNPITDGTIHLQLTNQPEGKYGLRLMNKIGQVMISKQINHSAGSSTELIKWDYNMAHGMYELEVTKPGGEVTVINVMY